MDKQFKRIIDKTISCLNWDVIVQNYRDCECIIGKKKLHTTLDSIKKDLYNLCVFIIENNISYFDQDQFIIIWKHTNIDHKLGSRLEIMYVPSRSIVSNEDYEFRDDEIDDAQLEISALERLLDTSIDEENYELAAILRDRITVVGLVH